MDAWNPSTNDRRPLGRVTMDQALGVRLGPAKPVYRAGDLIVFEQTVGGDERQVGRVADDWRGANIKIEPFSVYREGFLPPVWIPRIRILGLAQ